MTRTVAVLNALVRPLLEDRLPDWLDARWFANAEELFALAPEAEIAWFDSYDFGSTPKAVMLAERLKWLNTLSAGVDYFPLDKLRELGAQFTNGQGINAPTIAEYALMGMLVLAKGYREVVHAQGRHEWLYDAPGKQELMGSKALVVGAGGIGGRIAELLRRLDVDVTEVRRRPAAGVLTADQWRARLGEFDWVVIVVPSTPDTAKMIGAAELAAMKPSASILNFARGAVIDQDALVEALKNRTIAGAWLDVTDPEPLPADHPLWSAGNCHISMHLSGRSQTLLFKRAAERFLANLDKWKRGEPLDFTVDLALGY